MMRIGNIVGIADKLHELLVSLTQSALFTYMGDQLRLSIATICYVPDQVVEFLKLMRNRNECRK